MTKDYEVKINSVSKELTARERVMLKDTRNAVKLDEAVKDTPLVISPAYYAVLDVHNEKSKEDKDFQNFVVVDTAGNKYVTGSTSFFEAFTEIVEEMSGTGEDYEIEIYKLDSKNYKGKQFITCSIV
jgi:hypothetical protein